MDRLNTMAKKLANARRRRIGEARSVFPNSPKGFDGIPMPQDEYEKSLLDQGYRPARKHHVITHEPDGTMYLGSITVSEDGWQFEYEVSCQDGSKYVVRAWDEEDAVATVSEKHHPGPYDGAERLPF